MPSCNILKAMPSSCMNVHSMSASPPGARTTSSSAPFSQDSFIFLQETSMRRLRPRSKRFLRGFAAVSRLCLGRWSAWLHVRILGNTHCLAKPLLRAVDRFSTMSFTTSLVILGRVTSNSYVRDSRRRARKAIICFPEATERDVTNRCGGPPSCANPQDPNILQQLR